MTNDDLERMAAREVGNAALYAGFTRPETPRTQPEPDVRQMVRDAMMAYHVELARRRLRHARVLFAIVAGQWLVVAGLAWRVWG